MWIDILPVDFPDRRMKVHIYRIQLGRRVQFFITDTGGALSDIVRAAFGFNHRTVAGFFIVLVSSLGFRRDLMSGFDGDLMFCRYL